MQINNGVNKAIIYNIHVISFLPILDVWAALANRGHSYPLYFILQLMMSQRRLYIVRICSTIQQRGKRTSDTIVETTGPGQ